VYWALYRNEKHFAIDILSLLIEICELAYVCVSLVNGIKPDVVHLAFLVSALIDANNVDYVPHTTAVRYSNGSDAGRAHAPASGQ
jgi:hypothetical protein